jgi:hypothetical protein
MDKSIKIGLVVLAMCIALSFYIGSWIGHKNVDVSSNFKHKYDSLTAVIKQQENVMLENEKLKDSLRANEKTFKYKQDSMRDELEYQKAYQQSRQKELITKWNNASQAEIAKIMTDKFEQAHPAPLFDSATLGPDVTIGKNVAIHFLDRDQKLIDADFNMKNVKIQLSLSFSRINNLLELVETAKVDSAAQKVIINSQKVSLATKDQEIEANKKQAKKDKRRQQVKVAVVTVYGVAMTVIAILAASH